jgi:chromosome segregation ATPase
VLSVSLVYGYAVLSQENIQLEQIPGIIKSLPAMNQHLASFEKRLEFSRSDQAHLASQVQRMDANSRAAIDATRLQAALLVSQARQSLTKEINQRTVTLQSQVSVLASQRNAEQQLLAQMKQEITQARLEMEKTQKDYTAELAALRDRQSEQRLELASLSSSLPTRHVGFAVERNHRATLIPGVSFQLLRIDVRHQRYDGLIESAPGDQAVSVQSQGVRNPVMFYPGTNGKGFLLVVTRLDDKGAYGYLLMPGDQAEPATSQADALSASDDHMNTSSGAAR